MNSYGIFRLWLGLGRAQVESEGLAWHEPRVWCEGDETLCEWRAKGRLMRAYVKRRSVDLMRESWGDDWSESELASDFLATYRWVYSI